MKFSKRMERFGDEIFGVMNDKKIELEQQGRTLYNLSIGTPDFPVCEDAKDALVKAAQDPDNWKYALRDIPELLQAVCDYYEKRFGVTITRDMICSCYGSQEGMGHISMALADEGDTVLLPTPCYPVFIAGAKMAGAEPWYYPMTKESDFLPDVSKIPEDVARRAKYMIVSLPSNPLGSVGTPEVYREIIAFAKKYDILVIHDNAYSDIIFDGVKGGSFLGFEGAGEIGVEFFSLSKSFNLTGARISFLVGRPDVIGAFRKLRSQIDFGMFLPMQYAAAATLKSDMERVKKQCDIYQERRDALCGGLRAIGWDVPDSHGSMFVWAPVPERFTAHPGPQGASMEFCMELADRSGVIATPGSGFGPGGEGYVRFALTLPVEEIQKAVEAIRVSGVLA